MTGTGRQLRQHLKIPSLPKIFLKVSQELVTDHPALASVFHGLGRPALTLC
jgi:hypothetical protein